MVSENSKSIDGLLDEYEHQAQAYWDFMDQKEREEYAWMAGIIDGEGSIWAASRWNKAYKTREHHIGIYVTMTHEITVKTVKGIAKVGHIYPMPPKGLLVRRLATGGFAVTGKQLVCCAAAYLS
ncbi:unnamed protein product [marine sediment metagenome]|uniref:Homing endonuclease LAGLIDADG domain-containing protein n=1 Tax=marine sediment metagenome TaxID=412755 RepID=X1QAE0_9ZZZZ